MGKSERNGKRKPREFKKRIPCPIYYYIVTDTKETEKNYMIGLRDSIPANLRSKLVIKVRETKINNIVNEALNLWALHPQYSKLWIVFDRDQITNFDEIIEEAKNKNIYVGWSNPCIEIWFCTYFGAMPTYQGSVYCCKEFKKTYEHNVGQEYEKSDDDIYSKLCRFGDEKRAFEIAKQKLTEHKQNCKSKPSDMNPGTTLHILVEEIIDKVNKKVIK